MEDNIKYLAQGVFELAKNLELKGWPAAVTLISISAMIVALQQMGKMSHGA